MRERVREREEGFGGNINSHEGRWTTVTERNSVRREKAYRRQPYPSFSDHEKKRHWREKGISIFVDNLPIFYDNLLLRKLFSNLGKIVDCYSPVKKRLKTQTKYGFVSFFRDSDALLAINKMDGVVIFNHKLRVMKSRVEKRSNFKKGKEKAFYFNPSGKVTKTYAEVVANRGEVWKEKRKNGCGGSKELEEEKTAGQGLSPSYDDLISQINVLRGLQQEHEKKLEDLGLMCLALKNELNHRFGSGNVRRDVHFVEEGFENGERKEEEDSTSKVSETPNGEGFKNPREEEELENIPEDLSSKEEVLVEEVEEDERIIEAGAMEDDEHLGEDGFFEGDKDAVEEAEDEQIAKEAGEMEVDGNNGVSGHDECGTVADIARKPNKVHKSLLTKQTSLRFNHLGANSGLMFLS